MDVTVTTFLVTILLELVLGFLIGFGMGFKIGDSGDKEAPRAMPELRCAEDAETASRIVQGWKSTEVQSMR